VLTDISGKYSAGGKEVDSLSCHRWDSLTQSSTPWIWGKLRCADVFCRTAVIKHSVTGTTPSNRQVNYSVHKCKAEMYLKLFKMEYYNPKYTVKQVLLVLFISLAYILSSDFPEVIIVSSFYFCDYILVFCPSWCHQPWVWWFYSLFSWNLIIFLSYRYSCPRL